jgi:hypothetical protein
MPSLSSLKENTMPVLFFQLHLEYKDFSLKGNTMPGFYIMFGIQRFVTAEFLACAISCMLTLVRELFRGAV